MATTIQHRRGTTAEHVTFTGAVGEVTYNTTTKSLHTHDGVTAGGFPLIKASDLSADTGAGLVNYLPAGTGAVATDVQSKLRESVSVFDFMTSSQVAGIRSRNLDVQSGVANTASIQAALDSGAVAVFMPEGAYLIGEAIVMSLQNQHLYGAGTDATALWVDASFPVKTVGGCSGKSVIWRQAPGQWDGAGWITGGGISDLAIHGNGFSGECIRINRTVSGIYSNLLLTYANVGIYGTHSGWSSQFVNVRCIEHVISAMQFYSGWNGCNFTGCTLYGQGIDTQVLLIMSGACYGNTFSGGTIEGCLSGVRLTTAQLAIIGTDFEGCKYSFIEVTGGFTEDVLTVAGPTVTVTGCTFVGVPSHMGIEVSGATAEIHGNTFLANTTVIPANVYAMRGAIGADVTVPGYDKPCISEFDNTARGWGTKFTTGIVFTRMKRVFAEGFTFPNITEWETPVNDRTLNDYRTGVWVPYLGGTGWGAGMTGTLRFTKIGDLITFVIKITGATNSSTATASYICSCFPGPIISASSASVTDTYNNNYGNVSISPGLGGIVYMPTIASTSADIIITGSYHV